MEKIINYIKEHQWIDVAIIIILMLSLALLLGNHTFDLFTDRGREFIFPQKILNGEVPYKDITMIYFPLAYYINALIYKILGVSIYSLIITQTFLCTFLVIGFYYLSKEFLSRRLSFLLTIFIIVSSIFSVVDLFSFIMPYSYSALYGLAGCWVVVFSLIRLYKTDNIKYAYIASLAGGFAFACKLEYLMSLIIITAGLALYKRLKFSQYAKIFLIFLISPVITLSVLFIQGVTIQNITDAISFGKKFATTLAMQDFLTHVGMTPLNYSVDKLKVMTDKFMPIIHIIFFSTFTLLIYKKYKNFLILPVLIFLICEYIYTYNELFYYWMFIPIFLLIFICLNFNKIKTLDKRIIIVLIASFLFAHRTFFCFTLCLYGTYAFPFLALISCIFLDRFAPKELLEIKSKNLISFVICVLITLYVGGLNEARNLKKYPIHTPMGTLYATYNTSNAINTAINYINYVTDKNASLLVMQEGSIINFVTGRKLDMHCFMMDRLYFDAYGEEKAIELLKNANYDYLILSNIDVSSFQRTYLFEKDSNEFVTYIYDNYKKVMTIEGKKNSQIIILKKMTPQEKEEYLG